VVYTTPLHMYRLEGGRWRTDWVLSISNYPLTSVAFSADGTALYGEQDAVHFQEQSAPRSPAPLLLLRLSHPGRLTAPAQIRPCGASTAAKVCHSTRRPAWLDPRCAPRAPRFAPPPRRLTACVRSAISGSGPRRASSAGGEATRARPFRRRPPTQSVRAAPRCSPRPPLRLTAPRSGHAATRV
jgi:hypothetical protein